MKGHISKRTFWIKIGLKTAKNVINFGCIVVGSLIGGALGTLICPGLGTVIGQIIGGIAAGTISNMILGKEIEKYCAKHDK